MIIYIKWFSIILSAVQFFKLFAHVNLILMNSHEIGKAAIYIYIYDTWLIYTQWTSGNSIGLAILTWKGVILQVVKSAHLVKGQKKESQEPKMERSRSRGSPGNFILMMELRKKIITFRDIIDLPTFDGSLSINEVSIIFNTGSSVETS